MRLRDSVVFAVCVSLLASGCVIAAETGGAQGGALTDGSVASPRTYEIGDQIPARRVAVMDLKVTGKYSDQVRDWLPALIEDCLLREGWTLVVRGRRMDHIQKERNLPGVKPETKLPDNELLGATAFVELTARVQVKDIQGLVGYKIFSVGDYARASVDLTGQIVDPATGVLKSSVMVGGSASGVKTALVVSVGNDWRIGAAGYNLRGIRETLVGKAADKAASRLVERLKDVYPGLDPVSALQPSSTTADVGPREPTILLALPDGASGKVGDIYGVYRGDDLIAEVEILNVVGKRAEARILSQSQPIVPADKARKMPLVISVE